MWIGNFLKKLCYFVYSLFFFNCLSGAQQCRENYGNWWAYRLCYEWIDCWCSYTCWTCTSWNSGTVCNNVDDTHVYMFYFFFFLRQMLYFTLLCGVEILISKCTFNRIIGFHMGSQWLLSPLHKLFVTLPCDLVKGMKNPWLWMLYLSNTISYCHFFVWGSSEIFDTIIYFASMFASDDYNIVQNNL